MASEAQEAMLAARAFALGLPGAHEDFPWGERVVKVNGKVFVFLGHDAGEQIGFSVKLKKSGADVLKNAWAKPTGYGLGKAGWVSVHVSEAKDLPPIATLRAWIEESYRAVAPKRLIAQLDRGTR
ncbi:MAG: MmcQ/YjbR family DNA-binding protein [Myxococcota bacterium]